MSEPSDPADVERLQREVDELKRRNDELEQRVEPSRHRGRKVIAVALIVLAGILAPIATTGLWLRSQVTDTDKYVRTVDPLISDPAIQDYVSDRVTTRLFEEVDVQTAVQEALPERAAFLSGALTSGLQTLVREATLRVVQSDQFSELWASANRLAHEQMVAVLTGSSSGVVTTEDGVVSLDLSGIATEVVAQLKDRGITVFDSVDLQPGQFTVEIFQSDAITRAQLAFDVFNTVAVVLPFLTILLFVGGILLFPSRRRGAMWAAAALCLGMATLLLVLAIGRTIYLGAIPSSVMPQDVASTFFDTLVRFLRQSARALLAVGVIALLVTILLGPGSGARRFRAWMTRALGRASDQASDHVDFGPVGAWMGRNINALRIGVAVLGAIVLVAWDQPTALVVFVVALLALLVLGVIEIVGRGGRTPLPAATPPSSGGDQP
jgi:hypothetical protein